MPLRNTLASSKTTNVFVCMSCISDILYDINLKAEIFKLDASSKSDFLAVGSIFVLWLL